MNRSIRAPLAFGLCLLTTTLSAAEALRISGAWVREGPPNATVLAGYMRIENRTASEAIVVSADSPQFQRVEIHRTEVQDGIARMLPQEHLTIPAGAVLELQPGGLHLMLMQPAQWLQSGAQVEIELRLEGGGRQQVAAEVRPAANSSGTGHSPHQHH
ncbi:MAG: copper chaperone PCu(A)C [Thiohalobacteraceae bacterium]